MTPEGMTIVQSRFDPKTTMDRLAEAVTAHGITVLARIDHAGAAAKAGLSLRPTEVLIFGNPKAGTPLMQAVQTAGIDLPLKVLVWQDAEGKTWLGYNNPNWIAARHGVGTGHETTLDVMTAGLAGLTKQATGG
jgi:uncharacterized protein (DUF302 family)